MSDGFPYFDIRPVCHGGLFPRSAPAQRASAAANRHASSRAKLVGRLTAKREAGAPDNVSSLPSRPVPRRPDAEPPSAPRSWRPGSPRFARRPQFDVGGFPRRRAAAPSHDRSRAFAGARPRLAPVAERRGSMTILSEANSSPHRRAQETHETQTFASTIRPDIEHSRSSQRCRDRVRHRSSSSPPKVNVTRADRWPASFDGEQHRYSRRSTGISFWTQPATNHARQD